jgi:phage shock protein A
MIRVEKALVILEADAARLNERGEAARREAVNLEQKAFDAVHAGDDLAAKEALLRQSELIERATQHFDDALQLKWLVTKYRSAAAAMQNRGDEER